MRSFETDSVEEVFTNVMSCQSSQPMKNIAMVSDLMDATWRLGLLQKQKSSNLKRKQLISRRLFVGNTTDGCTNGRQGAVSGRVSVVPVAHGGQTDGKLRMYFTVMPIILSLQGQTASNTGKRQVKGSECGCHKR